MRNFRGSLFVVLAVLAGALGGCAMQRQSPENAYVVNAQGATAPIARSALAGSTAPGKQEILGLYIPFIGTGLAVKAGLEWDGTPTVIEVPVANAPAAAPMASPQCVEEQVVEYVPETRMVPRTRTVKRALVPVPMAAPPKSCPTPPPPPPVAESCTEDGCNLPQVAQK